jgi:hypothetical protein
MGLLMYVKILMSISIFAASTVAAIAQDEPTNPTAKLTSADVQHLAEVISNNKSKLRAYCALGKLHDETQQAVEENDADEIAALTAKIYAFEQELGPDYDKVLDGLDQIDLGSDEGQQIAAVFKTLQEKCDPKQE